MNMESIPETRGASDTAMRRTAVFVVAGPAPGRRGGNAHEDSAEDGEEEDSAPAELLRDLPGGEGDDIVVLAHHHVRTVLLGAAGRDDDGRRA